ncbi:agmatine deiminase family protein [Leisingera thetidis]|uniref:agmatine deiminase family protein n=1 Tax=Leisingera thetidis TaxID=2930199 RepID=UPI0021F6E1C1|nr:agmatine deiminase family protein [Leisingera thetidis]
MNRRHFLASATAALTGTLAAHPAAAARSVNYAKTGAEVIPGSAAADGFAFPAEWERHERTLMQFPPPQNWHSGQLRAARREWADAANTVAEFEPVTMAVRRQDRTAAEKLLSAEITLIEMPLNDAWSRDSGPMIVQNKNGERRVAGFTFNGWGRKFPPYRQDTLAKGRFAAHLGLPMQVSDLVLEGGAVAVDGQGTLLTTEECLLHRNRNPGWSKAQVEAELKAFLGVRKVIWLPRGLTPDPITDGHVDGIAAFAAPGVVLLHTTDDRADPNFRITQTAKRILQEATDAGGRRFEILEIPLTSYDVVHMNFYVCNGAVVVPVSGRKGEDDQPLAILREAFPGRRVVGVSGRMIGGGGGGVHCITQQVPAA